MPYRDFAAEAAERARARDPITFKLLPEGATYNCRASIPWGYVADLIAAPELDTDPVAAVNGIVGFLARVTEHDTEVIKAEVDESDPETVLALVEWLAEQYTARPTSPPDASSNGQSQGGQSSTSNHAERATVPSAP